MRSIENVAKRKPRFGARARGKALLAGLDAGPAIPQCDQHCERYGICRPDARGWLTKKEAARNVGATPSALRMRAKRVGYVSPFRCAMPRRDQPILCMNAIYFDQRVRGKRPGKGWRFRKAADGARV